ncbi:MAG: endonuclease III domain-containing protein [bacterium]
MGIDKTDFIRRVYDILLKELGPQRWWPAQNRWEVVVGAVLTQNTNWINVERAIENLKYKELIDIEKLAKADIKDIAEAIRPSGYFNQKARKLKGIATYIKDKNDGKLDEFFNKPTEILRNELLSIWGIGKESADSIILYSAEKPIFVVDSYTIRILKRHNIIDEVDNYDDVQRLFMESLERDIRIYNEYHALLVNIGKNYCTKRKQKCEICVLNRLL